MNYGRFDNSNISFCRFENFGDVYVIFLLHKPLICVRSPDAVKNLLVALIGGQFATSLVKGLSV